MSGTFRTASLSVQNTAANSGGYTEGLNASATASGAAIVSGNINNLGAQATSTAISVGLNNASTATAGLVSGTVAIGLTSNGTINGLADTNLGSQNVTVNGQGNEYAQAAYSGASMGTLSGSGASYTLNLGTFDLNSGTESLSAPVTLSLEYQVVPEPATWSMIVSGLGMLTLGQRLRRRSSK